VPRRSPHRDDRLQNPAAALGQRPHPDLQKILPPLFRADVPFRTKVEAWYHLTANISYPLMVVLSVLLMPAMIIRFYQGWWEMLYIRLPPLPRLHFLHLVLLSRLAEGAISPPLVPHLPLSAVPHGARHRPHHHQHHRRHGSPLRHSQAPSRALPSTVSRGAAKNRKAPRNIASASASSPSSNSSSAATSSSASGTPSPTRTTSPSPSCSSSSSATSIPACSRSSRDASSAGVPALTSTTLPRNRSPSACDQVQRPEQGQ